MKYLALLAAVAAGWLTGCDDPAPAPVIAVIPRPASVEPAGGALPLPASARLVAPSEASSLADVIAPGLRQATGLDLVIAGGAAADGDIVLVLDAAAGTGDEGYRLVIDDRATITAATPAGLFYGAQTVRQLVASGNAPTLPRVTIEDRPRFAWRGFMIDVARHFFAVAEIERLIDLAAYHKLNRLHLHLTDDQGWRIHIDSWPRLTEVGGATQVGGGAGGFYSQADYAHIVDYAAARFVTVVPEIDMPGHVNAALASYAELNESGVAAEPYTGTEVGLSSLWVDGPSTLGFVQDVLTEVAALTPGPWLHIGGDEARLTDEADYASFLQQVQDHVASQGKTLIGWEEVRNAGLDAPFVGQYWLRDRDARALADQGAQVIASPATHAYLDARYDSATELGQNNVGFTDVDKAYDWDPTDSGVAEAQLLGVEAPLWTETIASRADIDVMTFPRLAGHAEIAWSPASRDWLDYRARLAHHGARLDALGVVFYRSPTVDWTTE